jgi:outer membrane protein assembly factor BamD (BamD/ComL family)
MKNKLMELKEDIIFEVNYFYENNIQIPFISFIQGLKNLWKYKGIVWKDRWWDYEFLINIIIFKLDDMIKNWDDAHYVGSDFTKKRMIVIRNRIASYEDNMESLYKKFSYGKITKEELEKEIEKLNNKTWGALGKNIRKFWD